MRWRERRVEDELLKRELLLRLREEHSDAPGRSLAETDFSRRRARLLFLRHPLFTVRYHLLAKELDLEGTERFLSFAWLVRVRRKLEAAVGYLTAELWPQRLSLYKRLRSRIARVRIDDRRRRTVGVVAVVALAAATAAVVTQRNAPGGKIGATAATKPQSARPVAHPFSHTPRDVSTPLATSPADARRQRRVKRITSSAHRVKPRSVQRLTLVSNTVQATTTTPAQNTAAAQAGSPAPLPAPPTTPPPGPLKAPQR